MYVSGAGISAQRVRFFLSLTKLAFSRLLHLKKSTHAVIWVSGIKGTSIVSDVTVVRFINKEVEELESLGVNKSKTPKLPNSKI